ncbi:unnamed protein product, partial [Rotaria sp. Silwood1]
MPTRLNYNQSSLNHPIINPNNNNNNNLNQLSIINTNTDMMSYIGKILIINQYQVIVEDILGQG